MSERNASWSRQFAWPRTPARPPAIPRSASHRIAQSCHAVNLDLDGGGAKDSLREPLVRSEGHQLAHSPFSFHRVATASSNQSGPRRRPPLDGIGCPRLEGVELPFGSLGVGAELDPMGLAVAPSRRARREVPRRAVTSTSGVPTHDHQPARPTGPRVEIVRCRPGTVLPSSGTDRRPDLPDCHSRRGDPTRRQPTGPDQRLRLTLTVAASRPTRARTR